MSSSDTVTAALEFKPGINRQNTEYAEEGTWYDCDKVRFRDGRPENMRGRQTYSVSSFTGTARDLLLWNSNDGIRYAGFGTECFLYVNYGGVNYDVTPIRASVSLTNALNTQSGSFVVIVSASGHGLSTGDHTLFTLQNASVGSNVYLDGTYDTSVIDENSFSVSYASAAAGTAFSTGNVVANYYLPCGLSVNTPGTGYGVGLYSTSTYGTPRGSGTFFLQSRQWSLDTWGEDMVANPRGYPIFIWREASGTNTRAVVISAAPSICDFMFVTDERHMVALACQDRITGEYDPLLVRWSDQEDYNEWTPTVSNAAGSWRLVGGNRIVGGLVTKNQSLIWTDTNLYSMKYRTDGFIYGFTKLGENCGLAGPHAAIDLSGTVYWMSHDNFFMYDGRVRRLDSTLHKAVFERINSDQIDKIWAGSNAEFGEVCWHIPGSTDDVDFYVFHVPDTEVWYWGTNDYTTWNDNRIYGGVLGTRTSAGRGTLVYIEPKDIYSFDGQPYESYIESAYKDLADGDEIMFGDRLIPDFELDPQTNVNITFTTRNEPGQAVRTKGPYVVSAGIRRIATRFRGRQAKVRVGCSLTTGSWRYGKPLVDIKPDGKR